MDENENKIKIFFASTKYLWVSILAIAIAAIVFIVGMEKWREKNAEALDESALFTVVTTSSSTTTTVPRVTENSASAAVGESESTTSADTTTSSGSDTEY